MKSSNYYKAIHKLLRILLFFKLFLALLIYAFSICDLFTSKHIFQLFSLQEFS